MIDAYSALTMIPEAEIDRFVREISEQHIPEWMAVEAALESYRIGEPVERDLPCPHPAPHTRCFTCRGLGHRVVRISLFRPQH